MSVFCWSNSGLQDCQMPAFWIASPTSCRSISTALRPARHCMLASGDLGQRAQLRLRVRIVSWAIHSYCLGHGSSFCGSMHIDMAYGLAPRTPCPVPRAVPARTWRQSDETGPVADALLADFETEQGTRNGPAPFSPSPGRSGGPGSRKRAQAVGVDGREHGWLMSPGRHG